jgi:hypothetical protein
VPVKYWLAPFDEPLPEKRRVVRMAKLHWFIELDYRGLQEELALDHYEGCH